MSASAMDFLPGAMDFSKKTLLKLKMEEAARLLEETPDMPVKLAAFTVGFEDPYYFPRAFRRQFGSSPSRYGDRQERR